MRTLLLVAVVVLGVLAVALLLALRTGSNGGDRLLRGGVDVAGEGPISRAGDGDPSLQGASGSVSGALDERGPATDAESGASPGIPRGFRGRVVVSAKKTPFAGAEVVVLVSATEGTDVCYVRVVGRTSTDTDGAFALDVLLPSKRHRAWLEVLAPGYRLRRYKIERVRKGAPLDVHLTAPGGTVEGRLVRDDGGEVGNAQVWLVAYGGSRGTSMGNNRSLPRPVHTGEDGTFQLDHVPWLEDLLVSARASDDARGRGLPFLLHRDHPDHSGVTVRLAASGGVAGRLVDAEGRPWQGGRIQLVGRSLRLGNTWYRRMSDDGCFRITDRIPGRYALRGFHRGWGGDRVLVREVAVEPGELKDLGDVVVGSGRSVSGRLVLVDGPAEDLANLFLHLWQGTAFVSTRCDEEGRFLFRSVGPGTWALHIGDDEYALARRVEVTPGIEGILVDVVGPTAQLDLDVRGPGGAAIDPGLGIYLYLVEPAATDLRDVRYFDGESGFVTSGRVPSGSYEALVDVKGYALWRRTIQLETGEHVRREARLDAAPRLVRRVLGADGRPVRGADATLSAIHHVPGGPANPHHGDDPRQNARTDDQGRFDLPLAYPDLVLSVQAPGHGGLRIPVTELPEGDLVFPRGYTMRGRVTDAEETGVGRVRLQIDLACSRGTVFHQETISADDGGFAFSDLAPGTWRLKIHGHASQFLLVRLVEVGAGDVELGSVPIDVGR